MDLYSAPLPNSSYRLQLHNGFTLKHATEIIDYLYELGITHVYTSPLLKARPGSQHGYDVVDPTVLNDDIGTDEDFDAFVNHLHARKMGLILDIVPNHMGIFSSTNKWWLDVLQNGKSSEYAKYFDVRWDSTDEFRRDKMLVPVLGDHFHRILQKGELKIVWNPETAQFECAYWDHRFPLDPASWHMILDGCSDFADLYPRLKQLPYHNHPDRIAGRAQIAELVSEVRARMNQAAVSDSIARHLDGDVSRVDAVLAHQAFRLAFWRSASDDMNYRRFFDISDLAGICIEHQEVFDKVHSKVMQWVASGSVDALRIDHPDGLLLPAQYLQRLQIAAKRPIYVIVEKILSPGEVLREDWQCHGTSGYDYLAMATALMVDGQKYRAFSEQYHQRILHGKSFEDMIYECKSSVLKSSLRAEMQWLAGLLHKVCLNKLETRDFSTAQLTRALRLFLACLPVYRTYIDQSGVVHADDHRFIEEAAKHSKHRRADLADVIDFIVDVLHHANASADHMNFALRLQQVSGPATAKGIEDTAVYRYVPMAAMNEVGAHPHVVGESVQTFHQFMETRARDWPYAMNGSTTHDTKRSEDVRARLAVLSEMSDWWDIVTRWQTINRKHKTSVSDGLAPDANEEYLIYQTLLGVWASKGMQVAADDTIKRVQDYMLKALREAKMHTTWVNQNADYENAVLRFVEVVMRDEEFVQDFAVVLRHVAHAGALNSLSMVLIKLAAPGVADTYQGCEVPMLSLVDPDNRRPVNYAHNAHTLKQLKLALQQATDVPAVCLEMLTNVEDGRLKMYITHLALQARKALPDVFLHGGYKPISVSGTRSENVVAFERVPQTGGPGCIAVAARLMSTLADPPIGAVWQDGSIRAPAAVYNELFSGRQLRSEGTLQLSEVFAVLPVALLQPM